MSLMLGARWRTVLRPWHHRQTPPRRDDQDQPVPAPDRLRIGLLEWEQLHLAPEDGTEAAEEIARGFAQERLRATCQHPGVLEVPQFGHTCPHGICEACGQPLVMDDGERWRPA